MSKRINLVKGPRGIVLVSETGEKGENAFAIYKRSPYRGAWDFVIAFHETEAGALAAAQDAVK